LIATDSVQPVHELSLKWNFTTLAMAFGQCTILTFDGKCESTENLLRFFFMGKVLLRCQFVANELDKCHNETGKERAEELFGVTGE
jgi:hypothetical protein